ncbi:OmpA family protein [bacterium]|nr:OmpA family protein [bacterium]
MKYLFTLCICFLSAFVFAQVQTKTIEVYFDVDKDVLRPDAKATLDSLIQEVKYSHVEIISLTAHTDHDASVDYNTDLSKRRAESVNQYLVQNKIFTDSTIRSWHSELDSAADNSTAQGKQLNRRVEITVAYDIYNDVDEVLEDMKEPVQHFSLHPSKSTLLIGDEGVQVVVPPDAFMDIDGNPIPNAEVDIELEEFLEPGESFVNKLTTESAEGILKSGGMLRIDANARGKKLVLRPGKTIEVRVPNDEVDIDMTVYTGDRDGDGMMTWTNTGESFSQFPSLQILTPADSNMFFKYIDHNTSYTPTQVVDIDLAIPIAPFKPVPPSKPKEPARPDPEAVSSGLGHIFTSQRRKEQKADELYEVQMQKYKEQKSTYDARKEKYDREYEVYLKDKAEFDKEAAWFTSQIDQHLEYLKSEYSKLRKVYDQKRLNTAILQHRALLKHSKNKELDSKGILERYAGVETEDELHALLKTISSRIDFYSYIRMYKVEEVGEYFSSKGKLWVHDMKEFGFDWNFYKKVGANFKRNFILESILNNTELYSELDQKMNYEIKESKLRQRIGIDVELNYKYSNLSNYQESRSQIGARKRRFNVAFLSNLGDINVDQVWAAPLLPVLGVAAGLAKINETVNDRNMPKINLKSLVAAQIMVFVAKSRSLINGNKEIRVPRGTTVKAIFMATIDNKPHISIQELTIDEETTVNAEYMAVTKEEAQEMLDNL